MQDKQLGLLAVGAAFILAMVYMAHNESADGQQPRYSAGHTEYAGTETNPNLATVLDLADTGSHYFHPNNCVPGQNLKFLPVRYPHLPGMELTIVLNRGMSPMARPAPQDNDWRVGAPAELAW